MVDINNVTKLINKIIRSVNKSTSCHKYIVKCLDNELRSTVQTH